MFRLPLLLSRGGGGGALSRWRFPRSSLSSASSSPPPKPLPHSSLPPHLPLPLPPPSPLPRFPPSFFGGAGLALALLFLFSSSPPSPSDGRGVLFRSSPWHMPSDFRKSSLDAWDRITARCGSLCNALVCSCAKFLDAANAMAILVRSLNALLFAKSEDYANDFSLRWRLKVMSLLADLAAWDTSRRKALVHAGGGSVVDWLLDSVGHGEPEWRWIQSEAARAISFLLSDAVTCEELLQRPHALYHLLRFAVSIQPVFEPQTLKQKNLENDYRTRGRSMLVAAIMDIILSSCESPGRDVILPKLSRNASTKDIHAALKVLQEGGPHLDDTQDGSKVKEHDCVAMDGVGIPAEGGVAASDGRNSSISVVSDSSVLTMHSNWVGAWQNSYEESPGSGSLGNLSISLPSELRGNKNSHGLWDDLQGRYVAIPLAAWAVANWAQASSINCEKIAELDYDGGAISAAVTAPERTVKWHGSITAGVLLENGYSKYATPWGHALLKTASEASEAEDAQLAYVTLNSFYSCVKNSAKVKETVSEKTHPTLLKIAKRTSRVANMQKKIAEILETLIFQGVQLSVQEETKWCPILFYWIFENRFEDVTHMTAARILAHVVERLGAGGIPIYQAWLAMIIFSIINDISLTPEKGEVASSKSKALVQSRTRQTATQSANDLVKAVWVSVGQVEGITNSSDFEWNDLASLDIFRSLPKVSRKEKPKVSDINAADLTTKAVKALAELLAEDEKYQTQILEKGILHLLRNFMLNDGHDEILESNALSKKNENKAKIEFQKSGGEVRYVSESKMPPAVHLRKHAARMLSMLSLQPLASSFLKDDQDWYKWLEDCSYGRIPNFTDLKTCSYARATLHNLETVNRFAVSNLQNLSHEKLPWPRYEDRVFLFNTGSPPQRLISENSEQEKASNKGKQTMTDGFELDVVFVHGLCGGPFKTWRITDNKTATVKAGIVERIDIDSGREGTCWPKQWLASDVPTCRLLTVKYKTNLSEWSGATLPLQEVSEILLKKLLAAGVGERPVVFITHSMGGLVVKQMLMQALQNKAHSNFLKKTVGLVFYSCPHFGSKLADMPWRFGLVIRPSPSTSELRSGSARLDELNQFIRTLSKGGVEVLSFSETKVTPLVEGYGGWALRMEVVPIESAYPGFGKLVVLDATDHVNSCKPLNKDDAAYKQTVEFLQEILKSIKAGSQ